MNGEVKWGLFDLLRFIFGSNSGFVGLVIPGIRAFCCFTSLECPYSPQGWFKILISQGWWSMSMWTSSAWVRMRRPTLGRLHNWSVRANCSIQCSHIPSLSSQIKSSWVGYYPTLIHLESLFHVPAFSCWNSRWNSRWKHNPKRRQ